MRGMQIAIPRRRPHERRSKAVNRCTLRTVEQSCYARVRGTSTDEMEPQVDGNEDPWSDLWFYSNPVFVNVG